MYINIRGVINYCLLVVYGDHSRHPERNASKSNRIAETIEIYPQTIDVLIEQPGEERYTSQRYERERNNASEEV